MEKAAPRRFTRSMAKQKPQATKADESKNPPIEIEKDSLAKPPDSLPPTSLQHHQTKSSEAYFDTYLTQFDAHHQPPFFD